MQRYLAVNLDAPTRIAFNHVLKTGASLSEAVIFAMLGRLVECSHNAPRSRWLLQV